MPRIYSHATILALAAACFTASPIALAQAPAEAQSLTPEQQASKYFEQGAAARDAKNWKGAREAFQEAWKRRKHVLIALNLGNAEFELKMYAGAAEHLDYFLENAPPSTPMADKKRALEMFAIARKHVGALKVEVNVEGADVLVDAKEVGRSPVKGNVFVEPGRRKIEARLKGYAAAGEMREVKPGGREEVVRLNLVRVREEPEEEMKPERTAIIVGWSAVGAGAIVTAVLGSLAQSHHNEALKIRKENCPSAMSQDDFKPCVEQYNEQRKKRVRLGNAAITTGVVSGALGLVMVGYTWLPWPKWFAPAKSEKDAKKVSLDVQVDTQGGQVMVHGVW